MNSKNFKHKLDTNTEVQIYEWLPDNEQEIRAIVQIAHGMAEHADRYSSFAKYLCDNGIVVVANDHRGHGKTAGDISKLGYFADENGWDKVVDDLKAVSRYINSKYPNLPIIVFGHSMGSFLMRKYIMNPPLKISGAIICGTAGHPGILGKIGLMITKFLLIFQDKKTKSKLMDKLSFGAYNGNFKPNRTNFDWLSRDNDEVDKYINDPYCGFIFSVKAYNDLLGGLLYVNAQENINQTNNNLPIYLISGYKDPVGNNGKGIIEVYNKFKKAGVKNITMKLFDNGRHEILNEINKEEVYKHVLKWIKGVVS